MSKNSIFKRGVLFFYIMQISIKNIIGNFIFEKEGESYNLVKEELFTTKEQVINYIKTDNESQYPQEQDILNFFEQEKYKKLYKQNNTIATRQAIAQSVSSESMLMQSISMLNELDPILNRLAKKMREWYALYNPEFEHATANNDGFVRIITQKDKATLLKELNCTQTMGGDITNEDKACMLDTAQDINILFERREKNIEYIKKIAQEIMPNTTAIIGGVMATRMLAMAGSLKRLSKMPSSTVQLLGAESALFKHMKTGSKCPKYGYLINHPLVQKAPKKIKGKVARAIVDKVSIAVKVDYFKGQPIGEELRIKLEKRFGK